MDVPSLLRYEHPFRILESTVLRYGLTHPVGRLLKESGRLSKTPYYVVGYFSDDIKLGEGFGTSMVMASHRAATAALQTLYLATPPQNPILSIPTLPDFPLRSPPKFELDERYRSLAPQIGECEAMAYSTDGAGSQGWKDPSRLSAKGEMVPSGVDRVKGNGQPKRVGLDSEEWRDVTRERSDRRTKAEKDEDARIKGRQAMEERKKTEEKKVMDLWKSEGEHA